MSESSMLLMIDLEMDHLASLVDKIDKPVANVDGLINHMNYLKFVILGAYMKTENSECLKYVIRVDELIKKISLFRPDDPYL